MNEPSEKPKASDEDVIANAKQAIDEARRQLDQQLKIADGVDTKAAAIVTFAGVAAGLIVGRLHLDTIEQRLAAAVIGIVLLVVLVSAGQALRPRSGWSFGADLDALSSVLASYSQRAILLALANSLTGAFRNNAKVLRSKLAWYVAGLGGIVAAVLALGLSIQTGAVR